MNNFTKLLDACEEVDQCFIELSKAFGLVNHHVVLVKLESVAMHPDVIAWTTSFLACRSLRVKLESSLSDELPVPIRVPHGSITGSLLVLVMVSVLLMVVSQLCLHLVDDTKI